MLDLMIPAVEAALRRAALLRPDTTLLLALSGGADSVALLYALCDIRSSLAFRLCAAHVEHGLRGQSSLDDAAFCQSLCAALHVPFTCEHAALTGGMDAPGAEARAREARYALLLARARAIHANALLLAHHRDDQAETVLSHLIRGSGAPGLGGMREQTWREGVLLLRPLLSVPRDALLRSLDGAPFRTDASNLSPCCQRNRLRLDVLPMLTRENPRAAEHIADTAALLALDEACLHAQAEALLAQTLVDCPPHLCLRRTPLRAAAPAVAARTLRLFYALATSHIAEASEGPYIPPDERCLSAADTLALVALLDGPDGAGCNLPQAVRASVTGRYMHLTRMADGAPLAGVAPPQAVALPPIESLFSAAAACPGEPSAVPAVPAPLQPPVSTAATPPADLCATFPAAQAVCFSGLIFRFMPDDTALPPPDGIRAVTLPLAWLTGAQLRLPLPGDSIRPFGAPGSKPLRRYLTDRKLDPPFRPWLPLLCANREVLWAVGIGASESARRADGPAVRIDVTGALPWADEPARRARG